MPGVTTHRYGFFGPAGTFTEMALDAWEAARGAERTAFASVDATLAAVRSGEVDAAVVPIENSVEGGVSATLDSLVTGEPLVIVGERIVDITFVLAARPGTTLTDVHGVGTHTHAWAQVRGWMAANLPAAQYLPTSSTASAAVDLALGDVPYQAAVCAPIAAEANGLAVLAHGIGDIDHAKTRFVVVACPGRLPAPTGADKTTVTLFQRSDHAGGLLELLDQFAARGINLTRIESRPTKHSMGDYFFSVDCEGHVLDERVGEALMGLKRISADVRFLGSYARADEKAADIAPLAANADFAAARAWLDGLRG
jgi:prephenate dehydratase